MQELLDSEQFETLIDAGSFVCGSDDIESLTGSIVAQFEEIMASEREFHRSPHFVSFV